MSLLGTKLAAGAVLLLSALLMALLPFLLLRRLRGDAGGRPRLQLVLSCVQCFGGGVLLATVFAHMLPELHERLTLSGSHFPLAEVLVCAGMFSIYTVEELVELGMHAGNGGWMASMGVMDKPGYGTLEPVHQSEECHQHDGHADGVPPADGLSGFRVLVVAIALSAHSVFEGMAIGLERSADGVWLLTAAVAGHKAIIAFCLGEQFAASAHRKRRALTFLLVFVSAGPLGVLLGVLVTVSGAGGGAGTTLPEVLQALASGSILYVVVFEIIQGERAKPGSGLLKLAAVLVGFVFMLGMSQLLDDGADMSQGGQPAVAEGAREAVPAPAATR